MVVRERIRNLLQTVGDHYSEAGVATSQIVCSRDIHAFYRLSSEPSKVIHVQGYPGMSEATNAWVYARLMNHDAMNALRREGTSIGNEHEAVTSFFPNFGNGACVSYDPEVLEKLIAENVPELDLSMLRVR